MKANPLDPTLRNLNPCGCCAGTEAETPAAIANRPGLPAMAFRAGTHARFKASLLAALSDKNRPQLGKLRTREDNDFAIALLDGFAAMADVLTFYSERIANEGCLRTATERRSVLEMARALGYELAPGVAAQVMLSFTVEGSRGAPGTAIIPKGTKAQSIPGPGKKPQVFETSLDFTARAAWNELRPRLRDAPLEGQPLLDTDELFLTGTSTNLRPGDVLVVAAEVADDTNNTTINAQPRRVTVVDPPDRDRDHTRVTLEPKQPEREHDHTKVALEPKQPAPSAIKALEGPAALVAKTITLSDGDQPTIDTVGGLFLSHTVSMSDLSSLEHFYHWNLDDVRLYLNNRLKVTSSAPNAGVFALRQRLGFFGHNAPKWKSLPFTKVTANVAKPPRTTTVSYQDDVYPNDWDDLDGNAKSTRIWQDSQGKDLNYPNTDWFDVLLERPVPEAVAGTWIVLETCKPSLVALRIGSNLESSQADYGMSAKCARLNLKGVDGTSPPSKEDADAESYTTRGTTAHVHSEPLDVIGAPIETPLQKDTLSIELDQMVQDLTIGQALVLKGENADLPHTINREIIVIADVGYSDVTTLTLSEGLKHNYIRSTVTINANVVPATHGETTKEVLGNGDATQPFQRFTLKQRPLTYAFPPGSSVLDLSLEIWVDGVKWREVSTFFGSGPKDRVYIVRRADDGATTVQFGDSQHGARLPTGRENVRAVYRKGIGLEGMVGQGQIALLLTQPLGVKAVTNLQEPQGAEDPQSLDDARVNAPRSVLTLGRVVSLQDYEDSARDFPGVEKAHAVWTWSGHTRGVLLTLLGPDGTVVSDTGQPAEPLRNALVVQGNPRVPVRIVPRPPSLFAVAGTVRVEADRVPSQVEAKVRDALRTAFSFAAREFGQGVALSEVIAVIQNVPGVAFIDVTDFRKTSLTPGGTATVSPVDGYLTASKPPNGVDALLAEGAELLILDDKSLTRLEVKSS